jgi:hypothetical protein
VDVTQAIEDTLHHTLQVFGHVIIPESQHDKALRLKPGRAFVIVILLISMLPAIQFDNQSRLVANEIHDVVANRLLALELGWREALGTQMFP